MCRILGATQNISMHDAESTVHAQRLAYYKEFFYVVVRWALGSKTMITFVGLENVEKNPRGGNWDSSILKQEIKWMYCTYLGLLKIQGSMKI